jgi:cell division protein FtsB
MSAGKIKALQDQLEHANKRVQDLERQIVLLHEQLRVATRRREALESV